MRLVGVVALLLLAAGCATTRVVHLDTGRGEQVTYKPVEVDPVEVSEDEFNTLLALPFALDTVWEGVEEALGKMLNPVALKAMVTSAAVRICGA